MSLTEHSVKVLEDKLLGTSHRHETWCFPFTVVDPEVEGEVRVDRLTSDTGHADNDGDAVVVVTANDGVVWFGWTSDQEIPLGATIRRLRSLTDSLCDAVQEMTGLVMDDARQPKENP